MEKALRNSLINTLASKLDHMPNEVEIQKAFTDGIEYYWGDCSEAKLVDLENALDDYITNNYVTTAEYGNKIFTEDAIEVDGLYFESETEIRDYVYDTGCVYDSDAGHFMKN